MSTRASAKQQELEEQLAKLLCMIEMHAAAAPRTACSGTATKAGRTVWPVVGEQQQQRKWLMKQQREAEERIGALKDDLRDAPRTDGTFASGSGVSADRATGGVAG